LFVEVMGAARAAGRDPDAVELVIRANVVLLDEPAPEDDRFSFVGSLEQIAGDVAGARELGAHEVHFDAQFSPGVDTVDDQVAVAEKLFEAAHG